MDDKDLNILIDLVKEKIRKGVTKEEALKSMVAAGIMDSNGEYTEHYPELAKFAAAK